MTNPQPPTPPPPPNLPTPLAYATPERRSTLAIISMVLGICSIPTLLLMGLGIALGLAAVIIGFYALHDIKRRPNEFAGTGFAKTGISTGVVSFLLLPLLFAILIPSLGPSHELNNRVTCGANITSALKAGIVYAEENGGYLPTAGISPTGTYSLAWGASTGQTDEAAALADIQNNAKGNPASCLWILCIQGTISPKGLQCRSDPTASSSPSPLQTASGQYYRSPASDKHLSYSIASPWAIDPTTKTAVNSGVWRNHTLASVPMMADMAPLNGTPFRGDIRTLFLDGTTLSPKVLNSANHAGNGQEVGFGDAHVEWCRKPNVGQDGDNIWTTTNNYANMWGNAQPTAGTPIIPFSTTDPFDVIMIPCRNLNDNTVH